jgi:hypothetical protein
VQAARAKLQMLRFQAHAPDMGPQGRQIKPNPAPFDAASG